MITMILAAATQAATTVLPWSDGAIYRLTATPGRITDIMLEPGERLAGSGPVAAGDTARWVLGDTESGSGAERRVHILAKPTVGEIATNLVITTDRRAYHLEIRATAGAYMASVSWRYPAGELIAVKGREPDPVPKPRPSAEAGRAPDPPLEQVRFAWRLEGRAPWKPLRVFDDGKRVVIDFPPDGEMPPLFEGTPDGKVQLINYRVVGRRIVVDRLFDAGELRMGEGRRVQRVRLIRDPAR